MNEASPAAVAETPAFARIDAASAWDLILEKSRDPAQLLAIFDVREASAFAASHLEHALHLSETRLSELTRELPKDCTVVVYCYHGNSSQLFARAFGLAGFRNVYSVDGGFEALSAEHARRQAELKEPPAIPKHFLVGDVVFCAERIYNDGGVPELPADALLADVGARGVVVRFGRAEADPSETVYVVRFEGADGVLGPPVGCLPEELTQPSAAPEPTT